MQQILTNLKLSQSPPTYLIFTSECNVTPHVDAYASMYVCFNVSGGEHVFGPFVCFYWCFPDCLQGNVFTFCRNWWVWCLWHWKYALRKITGRARWPDLLGLGLGLYEVTLDLWLEFALFSCSALFRLYERKRKRSDSVLWQKPLHQQKCQKDKVTTQTTPQKSSIKQRLRTDLGRSVGVTTATQLVWLTGLWAHLPTNRNSRLIKRTHV